MTIAPLPMATTASTPPAPTAEKRAADEGTETAPTRISSTAGLVAGLRPGFRRCFVDELAKGPDFTARVQMTLRVAPDGTVARATATASPPRPALEQCFEAVVRLAKFAAPGGTGSTVTFPVLLLPKAP